MGILERYNKEYKNVPLQGLPQESSNDYSFFVRLVMRLSGGRVRDAAAAHKILLIVAAALIVFAFIVFLKGTGTTIDTRKSFVPNENIRLQNVP